MYDYLVTNWTIAPDYATTTLDITPQGEVIEEGNFHQNIHAGDDGSEERITIASTPIYYVEFDWTVLSESDIGTIFDFYFDSTKAYGRARSFKWTRGDGHTYVVRFDSDFKRGGVKQSLMGTKGIRLRILGVIAD